ncbi:relaxase/mobilization nuclease domain-containing protein (plasmid) [Fusobacterium polymorphum]|uniref:Relaxase n=1 Tax=Fusobacterium nucleatum subsp. polymorphum TaxID=76857 RepID=A0A2C6BAV6_FUSNP|nr:relaxase/mobilization nuclease domain-containing protein [Fusobacterium polymorphum]PHI03626.1 relaxase [Fusobacterium polymorphum]
MQLIMKIAEEKRMNSKGMKALFNYIARESGVYKTIGIGMSDDKDKAFRQTQANKKRFNKAIDDKMRFCFHEIISLEYGTDKELALKIAIEYCQKEYEEKGYNCFIGVHTDTKNTHIHILIDTVNFRNGKMLQSLTGKQLEKVPERENLEEVHIYERQRKLVEDIAIANGYEIENNKRYEYMHEAKKNDKNARKWLTKNQYQAFKREEKGELKEEKSWRNEIADKVKEMYKRLDITEDNIKEIAKEYNLEVTRHNKANKTITFAILDEDGKATKQRLKLVQALSEKSGKNKLKEEDKDKVKLGVKLERLHDQEKGNFTSETNPFDYNNFFRDRTKEIENNREFEEFVKEIEAEELEKELEKIMKEKEKTIKEVAENLIKNKENIYIKEQEKATEISKMIEINQKDYKQDEKKITNLEKELIEKKEEIPTLEENIKTYTNNKTILEEKLPNKEIEAEKKIDIADEKAKEVERLKALLQKAENEFYFANKEKEEAISDRDNTKERIENIDSLIKNNESKIVENKEKITIIPREVETLKEGLEEKKNVIAFRQEQLEKVFNNVKEKEQDYKNTKENALEKVLEYESYIKSLYEKKLEAEEEKKLEVAERYRKEIEEYQQNLIKQNIEWDRINKLNREIAEQVRLEREQKALAKKKLEAEARAKIELEEKIKTDLQNFINLIDKGKITNEDLIEMVDDLDECENWKDSHKLQYGKNIKFYLSDLENTIKVKSFFREADEVNKIIYTNEKLFKRISKYMDNIKEEKAIPNAKGVDKTVKEVEKVKKEEKEFE